MLLVVMVGLAARSIHDRAGGWDPHGIELALYDNALARVWDPARPELAEAERFRERFGADELVVWTVQGPALDADGLAALGRFVEAVRAGDPPYAVRWAGDLPYAPESLVFGDRPTPTEVTDLLALTATDPGGSRLLAADERGFRAALLVALPADTVDDASRQQVRGELGARWEAAGAPDTWTVAGTGMPVLLGELRRAIVTSMTRNLPLANLVVLILTAAVLRRWRRVVAVLAVVVHGEVLALAAFLASGRSFDYVSCYMAVCVVVVGFASAMHLVAHHVRLRERLPPAEAARAAFAAIARPLAVAQGTTALAMLGLVTADHRAIADFGLFAALGVGFVVLSVATFAPPLLAVLDGGDGPLARLPDPTLLGVWAMRHRGTVALGTLALVGVALAGLPRLRLGSTLEESFTARSATGRELAAVAERFGPISPYEVSLSWPVDGPTDGSLIARVDRVEQLLRRRVRLRGRAPAEGDLASIAGAARSLCHAPTRRPACRGPWPSPSMARALVEEAFAAPLADGPRWIARDADGVHARITVLFDLPDSVEGRELTAALAAAAREAAPEAEVHITGTTVLTGELEASVVEALTRSFALSAGLVLALLALVLRDPADVSRMVLANAIPIGVVVGLAGHVAAWTGLHVNSTALMYLSVVVGLVVDDTVFFLLGWRAARARGLAGEAAVRSVLAAHGSGIVLTSVGLGACFVVLGMSDFVNARIMGALTAATIAAALLSDLVLLPATCVGGSEGDDDRG